MPQHKRSQFAEAAEKNFFRFPDITSNRRVSHGNLPDITSVSSNSKIRTAHGYDSTYNGTEKLLQGSKNLLMMNNTVNNGKRGKSTRPMMQVKNGKLLLVKAV